MANCRNPKCKKPIIWAISPNGRTTPYDPRPVEPSKAAGFRLLFKTALGGEISDDNSNVDMVSVKGDDITSEIEAGTPLYSSHFQTCEFAGEFSRR